MRASSLLGEAQRKCRRAGSIQLFDHSWPGTPATDRGGKTIDHRAFFTIGTRAEVVVQADPGTVIINYQRLGQATGLVVLALRRKHVCGK